MWPLWNVRNNKNACMKRQNVSGLDENQDSFPCLVCGRDSVVRVSVAKYTKQVHRKSKK